VLPQKYLGSDPSCTPLGENAEERAGSEGD